ncbi:MAG: hypothetical protein GAK43_00021 [Stenotrophomonas maltophilia]|nr:MAG: hypothetical protein GAK43_00021 [Stenotrophomonas maltophilia]
MRTPMRLSWRRLPLLLASAVMLLGSGCAMVTVKQVTSTDYLAHKRGDVLTTKNLSAAAQETLSVVGLNEKLCDKDVVACRRTLLDTEGVSTEQRLSTLSELWVKTAIALSPKPKDRDKQPMSDAAVDAWLEAACYAYAYLFFSGRSPSQRAFGDRQT